jgi:hypothetical protein
MAATLLESLWTGGVSARIFYMRLAVPIAAVGADPIVSA